jgi:CrcB protein
MPREGSRAPIRSGFPDVIAVLWVALGGACGASARYLVGKWTVERFGATFPIGTLIANLSGCFLIGLAMALLSARGGGQTPRLLLVVGVLGGYTTFSSFAYESIALLEQGRFWRAGSYVLASNAGGLVACALGLALGRALTR